MIDNNRGRRAALAESEGDPEERVMAVMPGGLDEDAPQMGIAGLGNGPPGPAWSRCSVRRGRGR